MPDNKLVIRRLPPSMTEDDFLKQVSPLPEHDYLCFFEANSGLGLHSFSRAYINFLDSNDMIVFRERFDNYVFLDKDGHEYPAVVEQSLWHKSAKSGPFYKKYNEPETCGDNTNNNDKILTSKTKTNDLSHKQQIIEQSIEEDPDYIKFIEILNNQKKRPQQSPIQTLEANLDEITKQSSNPSSSNQTTIANDVNPKDSKSKVITPLISFLNQQRSLKVLSSKRVDRGK